MRRRNRWSRGPKASGRVRAALLFCDGALGGTGQMAGAGALLRDTQGGIFAWDWRRLPAMTNNEAEYAGLLLGLELAQRHKIRILHCFLDSEIVAGQMDGYFSVHSQRLRPWHTRACAACRGFKQVSFTAIRRERNRLADALANEALATWPPPELGVLMAAERE